MERLSNERKRLWSPKHDNNKEIVMKGLRTYGNLLCHAGEVLRNDIEVVTEAVKKHGCSLAYVGNELFRNNRELVLKAVRNDGNALQFASNRLRDDYDLVLHSVRNRGHSLEFASERLRNDKNIVKTAIEKYGPSLEFASPVLKNDSEIVLLAITQSRKEDILRHASDRLKNDEKIVLQAFTKNQESFEYAGDEIRSSPEIFELILTKVERIFNMKYLFSGVSSPSVINEEFFVRNMSKNGFLLEALSEYYSDSDLNLDHLRDRKDVVLDAVRKDGKSLKFASDRLREDETVVIEAIRSCTDSLELASPKLLDDRKFILSVICDCEIKTGGEHILLYSSDRVKSDFEVVRESIIRHPISWRHSNLKNDVRLFRLMIENDPISAVQYASKKILDQRSLFLEAARVEPLVVEILNHRWSAGEKHFLLDDKELMMEVISIYKPYLNYEVEVKRRFSQPFMYASSRLRADEDVVMTAVKNDPENRMKILNYLQYPLPTSKSFFLRLVRQNWRYYESINPWVWTPPFQRPERAELFLEALKQNVDYFLKKVLTYLESETRKKRSWEQSTVVSTVYRTKNEEKVLNEWMKIVYLQNSPTSIHLLQQVFKKSIAVRYFGDIRWKKFHYFLIMKRNHEFLPQEKTWKEDVELRKQFLFHFVSESHHRHPICDDDNYITVKTVLNKKIIKLKKVFLCI